MDRLAAMAMFVKSVDLGSFTAAADALQTSSQLVGKQVRALEQHLGVRLMTRTTRQQSLTDIGRVFYDRARTILADVEAAETLAAEVRAVPQGKLRINVPVTFGVHALAPKLDDYLKRYANVSVEVAFSNRYVDVVEDGFDVVFRVGPLADTSLIARRLRPYRLVLCAAPAYLAERRLPVTPMDLTNHVCLGFSFGTLHKYWDLDGPHGRVTVPIDGRIVMDDGEGLLAATLAGLGILAQSSEMVEPLIAEGRLIRVLPDYEAPAKPFHLLYAPDRRPTPKLRTFVDWALEHFGPT